jgi:phosphoenolpyruvate---glycerone phosphotransferase subunit DhaK
MKKLINAVDDVLQESLSGFCAAHADIVVAGEESKFVRRVRLKAGKVGLVSGGGSMPPAQGRCSLRPRPTRCWRPLLR